MPSKARLENFWIWALKKQHIKEIICWVKWGKKKIVEKLNRAQKCSIFRASKPRVKGGARAPAPPRIRAWDFRFDYLKSSPTPASEISTSCKELFEDFSCVPEGYRLLVQIHSKRAMIDRWPPKVTVQISCWNPYPGFGCTTQYSKYWWIQGGGRDALPSQFLSFSCRFQGKPCHIIGFRFKLRDCPSLPPPPREFLIRRWSKPQIYVQNCFVQLIVV